MNDEILQDLTEQQESVLQLHSKINIKWTPLIST